ncbi:MAG: AMP-binding protein, partial [Chloroflexota bacterium]
MQTIPDLISDVARRYGRRPALGIRLGLRTEIWSYQDVARGMEAVADRLHAQGLEPGDRVMVLAPNSPYLVLSMLGAWAAGAILVPVDLRTPVDVMARIREQTEPHLIITDLPEPLPGLPAVRPAELAAWRDTPHPPPPSLARGRGGAGTHVFPLPHTTRGSGEAEEPHRSCGEGLGEGASPSPSSGAGVRGLSAGLAEIIFTSGTTGAPKGVMLTHANILSNVQAAQAALPIAVGERLLSLLPLSHMMEQTAGLLAALNAGATIYYATSRRSSAILAAFQRHQIGLLVCVPEVLALLLGGIEREVDRTGRRRVWDAMNRAAERLPMAARPVLFRSVHRRLGGRFRMALCGGAALTPPVQASWERLGVRVIQGFGATECAPIITSTRYDHREPGTVGWPVPGVEIQLAADGEVLVRGPNVTPGYWHDPEATAATRVDGWYRTGDLGEWVDAPLPAVPERGERAHERALRLRG